MATILDDKDAVRAMAVRLRSQGYNLVVATDAISAISTARKERPDFIVLDLRLPGGDGFAVMERLKSMHDLVLVPMIVVSARDPLMNEERALAAGAAVFLQKPVDNAEFLKGIEGALSKVVIHRPSRYRQLLDKRNTATDLES